MIDSGVHGLIMLGTVGENCSIEFDEKLDVLRSCRRALSTIVSRCSLAWPSIRHHLPAASRKQLKRSASTD